MTLGDKPKYGPDFKHLDYVNPDAPKGGKISLIGPVPTDTFDNFNGYILKGDAVQGYARALDDVALVDEMNLDAYRFSVNWARMEPTRDSYDESAFEHYDAVGKWRDDEKGLPIDAKATLQVRVGWLDEEKRANPPVPVAFDGAVEFDPERWVDPERQRLEIDGQAIEARAPIYLALHKPKGVITSRGGSGRARRSANST